MKKDSPHIAKTKKRKELIHLPGKTKLYQSNRLVKGKYKGFTLLQAKIFVTIIKQLQEAILKSINNETWEQLSLFQDAQTLNYYKIAGISN